MTVIENKVIKFREQGKSYAEIGRIIGFTRQRAQQIYEKHRSSYISETFTRNPDLIDAKAIVMGRLNEIKQFQVEVSEGYMDAYRDILKLLNMKIEYIKKKKVIKKFNYDPNDPLAVLLK